jgi:choline dehydrogenase-like flavoprotein
VAGGEARGVTARTAGGGRLRVDAPTVVVACGTVHTPVLLRRSGLRDDAIGRNLSLHPATGVWGEMDEPVDMHEGVPQAYAVDEFAPDGIMLEGWTGPPDMLALSLPLRGEELRRVMLRFRHVAQAGLMIRDRSRGRVHVVGGRPVIRYDVGPHDAALLERAVGHAADLLRAAGARRVHVPTDGGGGIRALTAFHPLGTAAAGTVVDADLRVPGVDGLMVADGSVVPGALGVNPQLTIMALATRAAFRALGTAPPPDEPDSETIGRAPALTA